MSINMQSYRKSYERSSLDEKDLTKNPIDQFQKWIKEAEVSGTIEEVNAMTLTTIGLDRFPRSRVVLLKKVDADGFYFYTNYHSNKGQAITQNNKVCLSFFWPSLERQIIILGTAEKIAHNDSERYFHSRPKGSQLGAIASPQSQPIESRKELEERLEQVSKEFKDFETIPMPDYWGGYQVKPYSVEFWQGRPNRLHDRVEYTHSGRNWVKRRLAP